MKNQRKKIFPLAPRKVAVSSLFFGLAFSLFLLIFHDFFFSPRVFYERDMTLVEIPTRKLCTQLLREGNFALWTDAHGNGQPFMANPKNAVFYPTTWLYLLFPFFTAFKFHYFIHVIICWLGLYFLSQSYGLSRKASFFGASLFIFSGIYLSSFEFYNHIAALAWMPWVLFCLNKNLSLNLKKVILISPLWALMILAGTPEVMIITLILALSQSFFYEYEWKRRVGACFLSLFIACCLAAVQILPSLEMLAQTDRQEQARTWPLELIQLVNVGFPNFLGNDRQPGHNDFWGGHLFDRNYPLYYSLYTGFGALILAALALKKKLDRKRKAILWTALLFFLIACGRYSPLFFLYRLMPVVSSIRYPVKYLLGSSFSLSILAAMGYQTMEESREKKTRSELCLLLIAAGLGGLYWALKGKIISTLNLLFLVEKESSLHELGRSIETGMLFLSLYAVLFYIRAKGKIFSRAILTIILVLSILDPAFHNRHVNPTVHLSFFEKPKLIESLEGSKIIYRDDYFSPFSKKHNFDNLHLLRYLYQSLYPYSALGEGVRYILNKDFYASYSREYKSLMKLIQALSEEEKFKILEYLGCSHTISETRIFPHREATEWKINEYSFWLQPVSKKIPSVFPVFQTIAAGSIKERMKIFLDSEFDPYRQAVLSKRINLGAETGGEEKVIIKPRKESQSCASYSIETTADVLLVIPGNYARGWKARIDGKKAEVLEVNIFSKGVLVPSGRHEVEIKYLPATFVAGASLSLIAFFLVLVFLAISSRPKK